MEESELRAKKKMDRVNNLVDGWKQAEAAAKKEPTPKKNKEKGDAPPGGVDDEAGIFDNDVNPNDTSALFDDSDDEDDEDEAENSDKANEPASASAPQKGTDKELFGDSSSDEEEEFLKKRSNSNGGDEEQVTKKRKVEDSDD
jgi:hypothetical protein